MTDDDVKKGMRMELNGVANIFMLLEKDDLKNTEVGKDIYRQLQYLHEYMKQIKLSVDNNKEVPFWHEVRAEFDKDGLND